MKAVSHGRSGKSDILGMVHVDHRRAVAVRE